jgi:hypothetical protein
MKTFLLILISIIISLHNGFAQDYALSFDGNNDYVSMGNVNDFDIEPGESFTFCAWFKLNALPNYQRILCKRNGGNPGYEIWLNNEGKLAVNIRTTGMEDMSYWSNSYADDNNWHFVGFVINTVDKTSAIYFDGFLSAENNGEALAQGVSNDVNFVLGARSILDYYLNGVLDEVSVWKTALSETEIQEVMNGDLIGNEPGLKGYWRFDDQAAVASDYSINGYDGTIYGAQYVLNDNLYFTDMVYQSSGCDQNDMLFPAGRANIDEALLRLKIHTQGSTNPFNLTSITINLNGTSDMDDIDSVRLIYTRLSQDLNSAYKVRYPAVVPNTGDITFNISQTLFHGSNYFWVVCDVNSEATERNLIDAECLEFTIDGNQSGTYVPDNSSPDGEKSIILAHKSLFISGTEGIHTFRIPAIVTTNEGTLIAATDARVDNGADLGWTGNIDIVYKRSSDNGITWSEMMTAADFPGVEGASDCSMIYDKETDEIIMFYNYADETDEFQWPYMIKSADDGLSWSAFTNLNEDIYDPSWTWAFVTSGRGIQKSDGSLRHVINVMDGNTPGALIFGSDDHGESWYSVMNPISPLANESKLVQLDDGSLMINCRQENSNKRMIGQTNDDGNTWYNIHYDNTLIEPKCNASILRYTSVLNGYTKSRILFSNPASTSARVNMKVRLSYDEGETWTEGKVINPGSSAYSSLTVLGDRTIGLLYEAEGYKEIRFARFSLDWLTDGADTLHIPVNINEITSNNNIEIYPNPAKEFITIIINFDMEKDIAIEIIDLMGKPVIKREIYRTRTELIIIPTDSLSHGAYTVLIKTDAKIYSEKVLIIN